MADLVGHLAVFAHRPHEVEQVVPRRSGISKLEDRLQGLPGSLLAREAGPGVVAGGGQRLGGRELLRSLVQPVSPAKHVFVFRVGEGLPFAPAGARTRAGGPEKLCSGMLREDGLPDPRRLCTGSRGRRPDGARPRGGLRWSEASAVRFVQAGTGGGRVVAD